MVPTHRRLAPKLADGVPTAEVILKRTDMTHRHTDADNNTHLFVAIPEMHAG